jgi:DNA-binding transcriptional regulator LsrR (DeoR family)
MERTELLARVASLYYEKNLTQSEIASQFHISRSTVSRLLQEARDEGIVEIVIHFPWKRSQHLEQQLVESFSLHEARVLASYNENYEQILQGLGILAARYLESIVQPDTVLGISWGTAILSMVQALSPERKVPVTVVQMIGATGAPDPLTDGPELARLLADVYEGKYRCLHAPLVVENISIRSSLLQDPHVRETLDLAKQADVAVIGIGTVVPEYSSWLRAGYLKRGGLAQLEYKGAVGDICGWHYDISGELLDINLNRRIVGIELETLSKIREVIAIAGGEAKVKAVLGALRSGYVNTLVTDELVAKELLQVQ